MIEYFENELEFMAPEERLFRELTHARNHLRDLQETLYFPPPGISPEILQCIEKQHHFLENYVEALDRRIQLIRDGGNYESKL